MSEWISVEDRLPRTAGFFFVVADWMGVIEKGEFNGKDQWHIKEHCFTPTHWQPLPEPPEEKT